MLRTEHIKQTCKSIHIEDYAMILPLVHMNVRNRIDLYNVQEPVAQYSFLFQLYLIEAQPFQPRCSLQIRQKSFKLVLCGKTAFSQIK